MDARTAIKVLRGVKRDPMKGYGVCNNFTLKAMEYLDNLEIKALQALVDFSEYPEFSGDANYPLSGGIHGYIKCRRLDDFWSGTDGEERIKFIDWCISELEKKL